MKLDVKSLKPIANTEYPIPPNRFFMPTWDDMIPHNIGGMEMNNVSFTDIAIVSCGTLSLELNYLKKEKCYEISSCVFKSDRKYP
jgi:hypothetical protein